MGVVYVAVSSCRLMSCSHEEPTSLWTTVEQSRKNAGGLMFRPYLDVTSAYVGFTGCGVSSGGGEGLVGFSLEASEDGS